MATPASQPAPKTSPVTSPNSKLAGCAKIFREKITGTTADRPQLRKLMAVRDAGPSSPRMHQQREARARVAASETQRSVARSYNVSQATISRL